MRRVAARAELSAIVTGAFCWVKQNRRNGRPQNVVGTHGNEATRTDVLFGRARRNIPTLNNVIEVLAAASGDVDTRGCRCAGRRNEFARLRRVPRCPSLSILRHAFQAPTPRFSSLGRLVTMVSVPGDAVHMPMLRPVEVYPHSSGDVDRVAVRDRSGLSTADLSLSRPALMILALMDGTHTCEDIQRKFLETCGQPLASDTLGSIVSHLEEAHFLAGASFESHFASLQQRYRERGVRGSSQPEAVGLVGESGELFRQVLAETDAPAATTGTIRGLVAPHLDYPRGRPCYGAAYASLQQRECPGRVVLLGTNHAGSVPTVVATASDFETPLGRAVTDVDFLIRVEDLCGDLRSYELDHLHEHSIELQVPWLQHLFGVAGFTIVPFLIPDVCGAAGTAAAGDSGVGVSDFVSALADVLAGDPVDTLIVAGADLSHVGAAFGDERSLDDSYLEEIRCHDLAALDRLETVGAESFREFLTAQNNHTNICSAGSLYTLSSVLSDARVTRVGYHQAVDQAAQTCVTCTALILT